VAGGLEHPSARDVADRLEPEGGSVGMPQVGSDGSLPSGDWPSGDEFSPATRRPARHTAQGPGHRARARRTWPHQPDEVYHAMLGPLKRLMRVRHSSLTSARPPPNHATGGRG
jgi:hypothetical protein